MPDCRERILSNEYADIILDFASSQDYGVSQEIDYCYHQIEEDLGILYIERARIVDADYAQNSYAFLPKCYGLSKSLNISNVYQTRNLNTLSLTEAGITNVQNLPLTLTGKNVVIGFISTGIRYQEDVFLDNFGKSRILSIWDQTIQTGDLPDGFLYGSEYTNDMINQALVSDNPLSIVPTTDEIGLGSVLASVAAGSRIDGDTLEDSALNVGEFVGAAPDSKLVIVKLKESKEYLREFYKIPEDVPCYSETDILQAIQYLQKFAKVFQVPLVVCMGFGTSMGDHAGSGTLANYISRLAQKKSRAFVIQGGDEGNSAHHYHGELSSRQPYKNVEIKVGEDEKGFLMELWGEAPYFYSIVLQAPGGESIRWNNPRNFAAQQYDFVFEKTKVIIDYLLVGSQSGAELIRFRFDNPTAGIWNLRVSSEGNNLGGRFDIWLPIRSFISDDTYFLEPDPSTTITEPSYAHGAICVVAYQYLNDSIYIASGRGYSVDGYVVPDIAAPGVNVSTPFGEITSTAVATAITAGGCALLMQWAVIEQNDITVNSINIKNYLIRGAKRSNSLEYPNMEWGYGALNIEGVFEFLAGLG